VSFGISLQILEVSHLEAQEEASVSPSTRCTIV